jgi:non-specific serine/threonine protein kinase
MDLMSHQREALNYLEKQGGCGLLNLCPGSGKTLIALSYLSQMKNSKVLILAPVTLLETWQQEARKWYGLPIAKAQGTKDKRRGAYMAPIVVVGYEAFRQDWKDIMQLKWDLLILDESQKIKSPTSKVTKRIMALAKSVPHRILMSGTPLVNSWADMWSQCEIIKPGCLYGNFYVFRSLYAIMPIPGVPMIKGWRGVEEIQRRIAPHIFTVDKAEIQKNLPPITIVDIPIELSTKERKAYNQMRDEFLLEMDGVELTIANALVKAGRLRQCVNGVEVFGIEDESSKLKALKELLETLGNEHVIIFSMYAKTCNMFAQQLGVTAVITGDTQDRDAVIAAWRDKGGPLIMSAAGEAGLNLQSARYIIQVELPWTRASEEQRIGRAWRTGQQKPVTVYNLLAVGTIDYGVKKLLEKKGEMMDAVTIQDLKDII